MKPKSHFYYTELVDGTIAVWLGRWTWIYSPQLKRDIDWKRT